MWSLFQVWHVKQDRCSLIQVGRLPRWRHVRTDIDSLWWNICVGRGWGERKVGRSGSGRGHRNASLRMWRLVNNGKDEKQPTSTETSSERTDGGVGRWLWVVVVGGGGVRGGETEGSGGINWGWKWGFHLKIAMQMSLGDQRLAVCPETVASYFSFKLQSLRGWGSTHTHTLTHVYVPDVSALSQR